MVGTVQGNEGLLKLQRLVHCKIGFQPLFHYKNQCNLTLYTIMFIVNKIPQFNLIPKSWSDMCTA